MPMPYTLTKGTLFTLLENTLNPKSPNDRTTRNEALAQLRAGARITSIPWVTTGPGGTVTLPGGSLDQRLERDWFGRAQDTSGNWVDQASYTGQTTGYWIGYYGNVEAVLREGLIRAVEVSLGLAHDGEVEGAGREWPVEVQWKCPNPYFEVWVSWRQRGDPSVGQVTMLICTPPDSNNRLVTRVQFPPPVPGVTPKPTPLAEPVQATDAQGMWLVAHGEHVQHTVDQIVSVDDGSRLDLFLDRLGALAGLQKSQWSIPMPTTFWEDGNDPNGVVVVAPPNYAGGVDIGRTNAP